MLKRTVVSVSSSPILVRDIPVFCEQIVNVYCTNFALMWSTVVKVFLPWGKWVTIAFL